MNIELCKKIASELGKRYMEIMDYGEDASESDSVGTPFKDGESAIEWAIKEIETLRKERDEFENNAIGESTAREMALNVMYNDAMTVIEQLRKERDEARRMYCMAQSHVDEEYGKTILPEDQAKEQGWDCFKNLSENA